MIVAIDGPAGAGKSTVSRQLARRLGFQFLDTGAMYRAVAWAALERGHDWNQPERLVDLARTLSIEMTDTGVKVDGVDVSQAIRTQRVTGYLKYSADNAGVRGILVERQRGFAHGKQIVTEGRDQGSVVFPQAECKVYLTASAAERAKRRVADLARRGESADFEQVLVEQNERDRRDMSRAVGPLVQAPDATVLNTDGLSEAEVVDALVSVVHEHCRQLGLVPPGK
jgi:cytidylate kinase